MSWDPTVANQQVRCLDDPGKVGTTTGRTVGEEDFMLVEVRFGPNEVVRRHYDSLEPVTANETASQLAARGAYGTPSDLRRLLTYHKLGGRLTSIFYSMESSNTDFYPHQFKPVLKFIESVSGRILIADEVGLGKTIEAAYIWKELRARERATRLLIVCPSMLREKWQGDLADKFGIDAVVMKANQIAEELERPRARSGPASFVWVASLEALRPSSDYEDNRSKAPRDRVARLMSEAGEAGPDEALFDLVIIDEAHYLRNAETATNRLGRLLRDATKNLVLLTATPIQIGSENLYQLLKLLDPEDFNSLFDFNDRLKDNRPYTAALRALWSNPPRLAEAEAELGSIIQREGNGFADPALIRIWERLSSGHEIDDADRIEYGRLLESRSYLSRYMSRSRKREVLSSRVERSAQTKLVRFTPAQKRLYESLSQKIRLKAAGVKGVSSFALIARQRQLASCFPAALRTWSTKDCLVDFMQENLGADFELEGLDQAMSRQLEEIYTSIEPKVNESGIESFESEDEKYIALKEVLNDLWLRNRNDKVVVFAFFRGTLEYLYRRLKADGIRSQLIMGGMGKEKIENIKHFREDASIRVLLSSEVGSEGIDLQFSHALVNYDLPWNPMRVEQRIGRLDRLGQKAERISIVNFVVEDSIEDKILKRLYDRIGLFKDSIGDLEEILGNVSNLLIKEFLDPNLSDEERERKAEAATLAVCNQRSQLKELEESASNFFGFSDYLLNEISDSKQRDRWINGQEVFDFVDDFLRSRYPGSELCPSSRKGVDFDLCLTDSARHALNSYLERHHLHGRTRIGSVRGTSSCRFNAKSNVLLPSDAELIDAVHPLVTWIHQELSKDSTAFHKASCIALDEDRINLPRGAYAYSVQLWEFKGLRTRQYLAYRTWDCSSGDILSAGRSEEIVIKAAREGTRFDPPYGEKARLISEGINRCEAELDIIFVQKAKDYQAENDSLRRQQEASARRIADRKIASLDERIAKLRNDRKVNMIPANEGQKRAAIFRLEDTLLRIQEGAKLKYLQEPVGSGVIFII